MSSEGGVCARVKIDCVFRSFASKLFQSLIYESHQDYLKKIYNTIVHTEEATVTCVIGNGLQEIPNTLIFVTFRCSDDKRQ